MKKYLFFLLILPVVYSFTTRPVAPSAGVYLFATQNITTGAGSSANGHINEVEVTSVGNGIAAPPPQGGPGNTVTISDLVFTKYFDKSSLRLLNYTLGGDGTLDAEIRYYDGMSLTPVYKIILKKTFITTAASSNASCGTDCPGISESYSFSPQAIEWHNLKTTPAQILTYDLITEVITFTNN
jgi:type VI protein secretion system component Hcp